MIKLRNTWWRERLFARSLDIFHDYACHHKLTTACHCHDQYIVYMIRFMTKCTHGGEGGSPQGVIAPSWLFVRAQKQLCERPPPFPATFFCFRATFVSAKSCSGEFMQSFVIGDYLNVNVEMIRLEFCSKELLHFSARLWVIQKHKC